MEDLIITPKTKVAELLNTYPQLEKLLIEMVPKFDKIQNPILRKTIAKVTSLSQAAIIGGIKVEVMVSQLRAAVGQHTTEAIESEQIAYSLEKPEWFNESLISETIDTGEMLNRGEHPVHEVLSAVKKLPEEGILKVMVSFIPAPMIDKATSLNYQHWLVEQPDGGYCLYFRK